VYRTRHYIYKGRYTGFMKTKLLICALAIAALASSQTTRAVTVSWSPSTSVGITGYTISTGASATGPFTQIACTGTVAGSTCVTGTTASTTSYNDTETVGSTVYYQVVAVATACTPTTPVSQPCGVSVPSSASTTIPPKPAITTVVVVVQ
jgi:hypothetical protein